MERFGRAANPWAVPDARINKRRTRKLIKVLAFIDFELECLRLRYFAQDLGELLPYGLSGAAVI